MISGGASRTVPGCAMGCSRRRAFSALSSSFVSLRMDCVPVLLPAAGCGAARRQAVKFRFFECNSGTAGIQVIDIKFVIPLPPQGLVKRLRVDIGLGGRERHAQLAVAT